MTQASAQLGQQSANQIDAALATLTANALETVTSGVATVEEFQQQSHHLVQQSFQTIERTVAGAKETAFALGVTGGAIADALKDLPTTAEALAQEMPKLAYRMRNRAGLRVGDAPRSDADVMKLFEKIPGTSKLGVSETKIREFLADKHGSHIISRHQGGSNGADNILWEVGSANLQRGSRVMTASEQVYIRFYNAIDSVLKNSDTIAKLGLGATGTAVLTQAVVTAVAYSLDLYRGEITVEEFRDRIVEAALTAGIATPIFFLVFIAVLALFPELTLLLSAPALVMGFNALFGVGIALPLIQSVVRHLEAGGFGEEATVRYQNLVSEIQRVGESFI
ncbi:HNH endonuclease [Phormidium tenue FACHB-886]|nr:HNH endonuclease [Phormidium tenue FACHB-886]